MINEPDCSIVPKLLGEPGRCDLATCGKPLPPRRRRWCSNRCANAYHDGIYGQHDWNMARRRAIKRDGHRCVKCRAHEERNAITGRSNLEVNHIVPREGAGYGMGCWNHLDNLETLCHDCHVAVTNAQRRERAERRQPRLIAS